MVRLWEHIKNREAFDDAPLGDQEPQIPRESDGIAANQRKRPGLEPQGELKNVFVCASARGIKDDVIEPSLVLDEARKCRFGVANRESLEGETEVTGDGARR